MKLFNKAFWGLIVIMFLTISVIGCRDELAVRDFQVDSQHYQETGYFIGNTRVGFNVDLVVDNDDYTYHWTANGGRFLSQGEDNVEYITPRVPGDYNIKLLIKDSDGNELTYNFPFSVQGDYPKAVKLTKAESITFNQGVNLEWTKADSDDFYSYKILRSNNIYIDDDADVIAEIYNRDLTQYDDFAIDPNQNYSYQIMVINEQGYLSVSNEEVVNILAPGIEELEIGADLADIVVDQQRERVYILKRRYNKLLILDINDFAITDEIPLSSGVKELFLTEDQKRLFILNEGEQSISQIELDSLKYDKLSLEHPVLDISLLDDYLYALVKSSDLSKKSLLKFELSSMKEVENYSFSENKLDSFRKIELINQDYLIADKSFGDTIVYDLKAKEKIDSVFTGPISDISVLNKEDEPYQIYIASRNNDSILKFEFNPKQGLKQQGRFDVDGYPQEFVLNLDKELLFTVYDEKSLAIYSTKDHSLLEVINLRNYAYNIDFFATEEVLFLLTANISGQRANLTRIDLDQYGIELNGG